MGDVADYLAPSTFRALQEYSEEVFLHYSEVKAESCSETSMNIYQS